VVEDAERWWRMRRGGGGCGGVVEDAEGWWALSPSICCTYVFDGLVHSSWMGESLGNWNCNGDSILYSDPTTSPHPSPPPPHPPHPPAPLRILHHYVGPFTGLSFSFCSSSSVAGGATVPIPILRASKTPKNLLGFGSASGNPGKSSASDIILGMGERAESLLCSESAESFPRSEGV
jgi:hypothetical protein